ncbi:MAG: hypothetical protein SCALA702_26740 [Melioribacteraceae bacterium]|nr:MAG: hypothetical protein SCALA702_26740 [Melioribacteraceae bacterium]
MSDVIKLKSNTKLKVRLKTPFEEYVAEQGVYKEDEEETPEDTVAIQEAELNEKLDAAYRQGYNEGMESAQKELAPQYHQALEDEAKKFKYLIDELNGKFKEYGDIFDQAVIELSFALAEKIIQKKLEKDNNINDLLRNAIKKVLGANNVYVRLNPEDVDTLNEETKKLFNSDNFSNIKFEGDDSIDQGGCFIETEIGNVDARISTQINELKRLFKDSREEDAE